MKRVVILLFCAMLAVSPVHAAENVTTEPTKEVTTEPTKEATAEPTKEATAEPTKEATAEPTKEVTAEPTNEAENSAAEVNSHIIIGGKEYKIAVANAGQSCEIAVPLVNLGNTDVTNVVITPVLSGEVGQWPFEISKTDYAQTCERLEGVNSGKNTLDRKHTFRWALQTRTDAVTGYTKLTFQVAYNEADGSKGSATLEYYVQVNGVSPTEEETMESGKISTPRVIVTGFTTVPEEVYAGDTFQLTLHLKNTSKITAVRNMLFDIQGTAEGTDANNTYAAFLPTAGSSTIYLERIAANSGKDITIELKSKADLAQKPYVITVEMEYEDEDANAFTETASVSIPIKQQAKVDISSVSVMPENLEIGNEANVMFSIYNVGKTKLYNVNVKFEADSVSGGEVFLGNLESGATGAVDAYLMAENVTLDDGTVKILIQYEDEEGKVAAVEKTMNLYVSEVMTGMSEEEFFIEEPVEEAQGVSGWLIGILAAVVALGGGVGALVLHKKKNIKKQQQKEKEILDLLSDEE